MATPAVLYLLNSTDDDPDRRIVITPRAYDGPGGVQRTTDLTFYGNGAPNWGERFNENFYHLLENFAVAEQGGSDGVANLSQPPVPKTETDLGGELGLGVNNPIEGQLWYNKSRGLMYVYTGVQYASPGIGVPAWKPTSNVLTVSNAAQRDSYFNGNPGGARSGDFVYNQDTGVLEIFDGTANGGLGDWVSTSNFVKLDGSNTPMTGALRLYGSHLSTDPNPATAASQGYVNALVGGVGGGIITAHSGLSGLAANDHDQYLQRNGAGGQMTGALNMNNLRVINVGTAVSGTDALNWNTADGRYVNTGGDTMTGNLTMTGGAQVNMNNAARIINVQNPINAQDAATKAYVDGLLSGGLATALFGASGWLDLPVTVSGTPRTLIIQWSNSVYFDFDGAGWDGFSGLGPPITFPKVFPNAVFQVVASARGLSSPGEYSRQLHQMCVRNEYLTTSGFRIYMTEDDGKVQNIAITYIAIGW